MTYFVSSDNVQKSLKNDAVLVFHFASITENDVKLLFQNGDTPFILEFASEKQFDQFLESTFLLNVLFNKNYHFINGKPLFKVSEEIPNIFVDSFLEKLSIHGYESVLIWQQKRVTYFQKNFKKRRYDLLILNSQELENSIGQGLLPNAIIECKDVSEYEKSSSLISEYLKQNPSFINLYSKSVELYKQQSQLTIKLVWYYRTLENYKTYNQVLKSQIRQGRLFKYGSKLANQVRRISFLRKLFRKIQK